MPRIRALYCVAQYVPDDGRAEAANTGVLLFVPSLRWMKMRVTPSLERVRKFFDPTPSELLWIKSALDSLVHRMQLARDEFTTEEDLAQFVRERADMMRLTTPRLVMIEDPERDLNRLYDQLCGDCDAPLVLSRSERRQ